MRRGAAGLRRLVPDLEEIATSPLVRALQTAEILAAVYEGVEVVVAEPLAPGHGPQDVLAWIDQRRPARTLAAVGHEPGSSRLASWLLSGEERSFLELKKGAACLLELSRLAPAAGTLLWLAPPRTLRRVGE
jgi:phosphohistidine phosphatase